MPRFAVIGVDMKMGRTRVVFEMTAKWSDDTKHNFSMIGKSESLWPDFDQRRKVWHHEVHRNFVKKFY